MKTPEQMQAEWAEEIEKAGAATEQQMREADVPRPKSPEELMAYIKTLVERPHDYGTCCYAMSMASVAAYQYVAHVLGTTGFQAGCATRDIIRRNRRCEMFRIQVYDDLLFPQYCTEENFPTWRQAVEEHKEHFAKEARKKLEETGHAHPEVVKHWKWLASLDAA